MPHQKTKVTTTKQRKKVSPKNKIKMKRKLSLWDPFYHTASPRFKRKFKANMEWLEAKRKGDPKLIAEKRAAHLKFINEDIHPSREMKVIIPEGPDEGKMGMANIDVKIIPTVKLLNKIGLQTRWSCQGTPGYSMGYIIFYPELSQEEIIEKLSKVFKAKPQKVPAPADEPVFKKPHDIDDFPGGQIYKIGPVLIRHRFADLKKAVKWGKKNQLEKYERISIKDLDRVEMRFRPRDIPKIEKALEAAK